MMFTLRFDGLTFAMPNTFAVSMIKTINTEFLTKGMLHSEHSDHLMTHFKLGLTETKETTMSPCGKVGEQSSDRLQKTV